MKPLKDIEWKQGLLYACAGESKKQVTRQYFMDRSGISNDNTLNLIERECRITLKK